MFSIDKFNHSCRWSLNIFTRREKPQLVTIIFHIPSFEYLNRSYEPAEIGPPRLLAPKWLKINCEIINYSTPKMEKLTWFSQNISRTVKIVRKLNKIHHSALFIKKPILVQFQNDKPQFQLAQTISDMLTRLHLCPTRLRA